MAFCTAAVLVAVGASLWGVVPGIELVPALGVLVLPAGVAVAVLRYRLYDLDLVVNRTAVYAVLTVGVVACYVLVVGLVGSYATRRADLVVALVVTGAVAVGVHPARARVQRLVNRLMFGERDDPYLALARVGHALGSALRVDAALPGAVEAIGRTLALQHVALVVHGADDAAAREVAAYGTPGPEPLVVPLVHQGEHVGDLLLAARPGERLRERDRRLLADLAPQVAAAVHAVALAEALEAARRRQAALREEERRRIRRDLHDGLGPALAGLTFTIDAARNLSATDRDRADELLAAATEHVAGADDRRPPADLRPAPADARRARAGRLPARPRRPGGDRRDARRRRGAGLPAAARCRGRGRDVPHRTGGADQRPAPRRRRDLHGAPRRGGRRAAPDGARRRERPRAAPAAASGCTRCASGPPRSAVRATSPARRAAAPR